MAGAHNIVPSLAVGSGLPNYAISYVDGTLTVNLAPLTITANNATKTYGQTLTFAGTEFASVGLLNGDTIGSVHLASAGAAAGASVSGSPYSIMPSAASGGGAGNYSITYSNGTLTVSPATLTITASNLSMTPGSPVPALTAAYTGFVNGDTTNSLNGSAALSTAATSSSGLGTYTIAVTLGTINDANYTYSFVDGILTVQQPTLTITANDTNMIYGSAVPSFSFAYSGFVNGDTPSSLATPPSATTTATSQSHVGTYPITPGGAVDTNYTIVYAAGPLTINPAPLTITALDESAVYGQPAALPGSAFTTAGLLNGDTIAGVTLNSTGATPTSPAGTYSIVPSAASGPRAGNYSITHSNGTLTVSPAPLTIAANSQTKYFGQAFTFAGTEFASSGLRNGETIGSVALASAGAPANAPVSGSPYAITVTNAAGGTFSPGNYTITYEPGLMTVLPDSAPPMISQILPSAGPIAGGITVTILGTGFETGGPTLPAISFGGRAAASVVGNSTELQCLLPSYPSSGAVDVIVLNPDGNTTTASNGFTYGVGPSVTLQPVSQSINQGSNVVFQIAATGDTNLSYQWQYNGAGLFEDTHDVGTQTTSLTINNVTSADAGNYRCQVSNPYATAYSDFAMLSVVIPPAITQPPQPQSVGYGGSASFSVTASGTTPLTYQWFQGGQPLNGQTSQTLNVTGAQGNTSYSVIVANGAGSVTSAPVSLTLLSYCASVSVAQATYPEGTTFIPINVQTFDCGTGTPVANVMASAWISIDGTSVALPVTTDASGNAVAYFTPLPTEVGVCQYGSGLPGQGPPDRRLGSFTIIGMNLSPQSESPQLVVGFPQTNTLLLNNLTAVPLTNITATVLGAPTNVNIQVSVPSSLPGNGAVQTTYILEATGTTPAQAQFLHPIHQRARGDGHAALQRHHGPVDRRISATPASLIGAMIEGNQTLVTFTVTNFGGAPSGPLLVNLPAAPWLSVVTAQPIPSLAPSQSATIILALTPTNGQTLGEYPGSLVVAGIQHRDGSIYFHSRFHPEGEFAGDGAGRIEHLGAGNPNLAGAT